MQCDIVRSSGWAIPVLLAEMQSENELFDSPNTLRNVEAHLLTMAQTLAHFSSWLQMRLVRIDWHGWQQLRHLIEQDIHPRREEVWYGIQALAPATLDFIAQLRRQEPTWFEIDY
ncbi:MAG TPA: hypothetical protein VGC24_06940 [Burkholderiaceae bacterium]